MILRAIFIVSLVFISCTNKKIQSSEDNILDKTEQAVGYQQNTDTTESILDKDAMDLLQSKDSWFSKMFVFIKRILITSLFVIILGLIYLKRKSYLGKISDLERKVSSSKNDYEFTRSKLRKSINERNRLEDVLKVKDDENKWLRNKLAGLEKNLDDGSSNTKRLSVESTSSSSTEKKLKETDIEKLELYFQLPNDNGSFSHKNGVEHLERKRLYKIVFEENKDDGILEFVTSEYDGIAINHKDSMLKPVCDIIEINENNPINIKQINPGKVKRLGEEWIVETKINIKIL